MSKKIGILGGMGPMATVDLFAKIVKNTPAATDQEHIRIIIDNHPQIPSRVCAILEGTESPLPALVESARLLEAAGVDFIIMPCNTAHFWLEELQKAVKVPIYSMIDHAAAYIQQHYPHFSGRIMLLASTATVQTNLYQNAFHARGLELRVPEPPDQEIVARAIDEVKAGHIENNAYLKQINVILNRYVAGGILAFIGGCTEIPLLYPYLEGDFAKLDPTLMLALMAIERAREDC
ncbi:MAG TPA: amino acid racemase [Desulfotomaculum sp.]|nr:amino acid racemase [Desulfotomaculum sp.]